MYTLIVLGCIFTFALLLLWNSNRTTYPLSRTGKPFVERDADGFLTLESYQSHIKRHWDGSFETDIWALTQTRSWHDTLEATRKISEQSQHHSK